MKTLHRKSSANKFSACDLLQLDDSIRERESNLRNLYQEVKQLNIAKRKQEKEREKREKEEKMGRIIKLSEEVRKQKEIM